MTADTEAQGGMVGTTVGAITRIMREQNLMPGQRLPSEATLARELQVSRTVVREAFRSLAAMRIIELATGKRATVAPLDHGPMSLIIEHGVRTDQISIQHIYDVRRAIEARTATLAALRRTDAEARTMLAEAQAMRAAVDEPERLMRHDMAFHMALARASRNPVFVLIMGAFQDITMQTWQIGWRIRTTNASREVVLANHERIAAAVIAGDPEAAAAAMTLHFDESLRALVSAGLT